MIDIRLYDENSNAELFISQDSGCISFTAVLNDGKQLDFNTDKRDWELIKDFIDSQIKNL